MTRETRNLLGGLAGCAIGILGYRIARPLLGFGPSKLTWGQLAVGFSIMSSVLIVRWLYLRKAPSLHA